MKISTKGRYALRLMLDVALHSHGAAVPLRDVAQRQEISDKYLEQIVTQLSRAGLVRSVRGAGGGYLLTREPEEYTVGEILQVTEGSLSPVACLQYEVNDCPMADTCMTLPVWKGLYRTIQDYLYSITLQDIIDNTVEHGNNFCI